MARMAKSGLKPPIEMNADKPVRISQMANKRNPTFLVKFIKFSFYLGNPNGHFLFIR